jgi:hypothetical protein
MHSPSHRTRPSLLVPRIHWVSIWEVCFHDPKRAMDHSPIQCYQGLHSLAHEPPGVVQQFDRRPWWIVDYSIWGEWWNSPLVCQRVHAIRPKQSWSRILVEDWYPRWVLLYWHNPGWHPTPGCSVLYWTRSRTSYCIPLGPANGMEEFATSIHHCHGSDRQCRQWLPATQLHSLRPPAGCAE